MRLYEDIQKECGRIEACIKKYGHTSDHNLDWFLECVISKDGKAVFVEFDDGAGLLTHKYEKKWSIWSDPLSSKSQAVDKILEFSEFALTKPIKDVWCIDVSDDIKLSLEKNDNLKIGETYYSLQWPVLDVEKYDPGLSGGHFKEMRNAKNKFYREHGVEILETSKVEKQYLHEIVDKWKANILTREDLVDIYELKYHNTIDNNFRGFLTARVLMVDGRSVGFNAGYEVPNHSGRFAGIIGIHDYSLKDLGTVLWLEDLEWIKRAGYKELDMQGSEDDGGLKLKLQFGAKIERKTDTFSIIKK